MPTPKTDKDFEAESDARTLVRARQVTGDPKRNKAAIAYLKAENKETQATIKAASGHNPVHKAK